MVVCKEGGRRGSSSQPRTGRFSQKNIFVAGSAGSVVDRGGADLSAQNGQIRSEVLV